jgi:hypothetical protein
MILIKKILSNEKMKPSDEKNLYYFRDNKIISMLVCRQPISTSINSLLNVLSIGQFNENLKNSPYDRLFHLSLYITVEGNASFVLEKNQRVTFYANNS